jgi:hypothetical protein
MTRHWSERLSCQCGAVFRTAAGEACHRHNFPALCRPKKRPGRKPQGPDGLPTPRKSRAKPKPLLCQVVKA